MIKVIFFDLDDTLYSFKGTKLEVKSEMKALEIAEMLQYYARFIEIKKELTKGEDVMQEDRTVWFRKLLEEKGKDPEKAVEMNQIYWQTLVQGIELYRDFKQIEPELRKKYKLGVITDGIKKYQLDRFNALGITDFDFFITSEEVGMEKPNIRIFQKAIEIARCDPEEAMMVGDNPIRDIKGAKKAGLKTVRLRRGYYSQMKSNADYEIENYEELIPILGKFDS